MKSKNPKSIKKGMCLLIVAIVILTTLIYTISGYKSNKLAIAKANSKEALATLNLTELKNNESAENTFLTNGSVIVKNENDIRYVKLAVGGSTYFDSYGAYEYLVGDLDKSGVVDVDDAAQIWKHLGGRRQLTDIERLAADVNGDGVVNEADLYSILYGIATHVIDPSTNLRASYLIGDPDGTEETRTAAHVNDGSIITEADADILYKAVLGNATDVEKMLSDYNMDFMTTEVDWFMYSEIADGDTEYLDTIKPFLSAQLANISTYKNKSYGSVRSSGSTILLPPITEEGEYTLTVGRIVDSSSNKQADLEEETYTIIIDKTAPKVESIEYDPESLTNGNVEVTIHFSEPVSSGDGEYSDEQTVTFRQNDTKTLIYYDEAGNAVMVPITIDWIDKDGPILKSLTYDPSDITRTDVKVTLKFMEDVKINPDDEGEVAKDEQEVTFTENGIKYLTFYDEAKNPLVVPILITNIDKEAPIYLGSHYSLTERSLGSDSLKDRLLSVDVTFNENIALDSNIKLEVKIDGETKATLEPKTIEEGSIKVIHGGTVNFEYEIPVNCSGEISATVIGTVKDYAGNQWGTVEEVKDEEDQVIIPAQQNEMKIDIPNIGTVKQVGIVADSEEYLIKIDGKQAEEGETYYINDYNRISIGASQATVSDCGVTNNKVTTIKGDDVTKFNINIRTTKPMVTPTDITEYPEVVIKDDRYIENKRIIIKVSADTELAEADIDIQVGFSVSGVGKYNYDGTAGKAKFERIDGKDVYYSYEIQPGDEGTIMYIIKDGTIKDIYGNETDLSELETATGEKLIVADELPLGLDEINYTLQNSNIELVWAKEDSHGNKVEISGDAPTAFIPGEKLILTVISKDGAELSDQFMAVIYTDKGAKAVVKSGFTRNSDEYVASWSFTQKEKMVGYIISDGDSLKLDDDPNVHRNGNIYADTRRPQVIIEADKQSPTNADQITYTFTFSEEVRGFDLEKIIVNNGTKGKFTEVTPGWVYTLEVTPNVNTGSQEIVEVRVEEGACVDIVNRDLVGAISKIVVDRIKPELNYDVAIVPTIVDGKVTSIKITETFSEAINIERNDDEDDEDYGKFLNGMIEPTINIGGNPGYGTLEVVDDELTETSVSYIYTISGADDGEVSITLAGKVIDLAGNESENISRTINTGIALTRSTIIIDGAEVAITTPSGAVTDFEKDIYVKAGDTITVTVMGETNTVNTITIEDDAPEDGLYTIAVDGTAASLVTGSDTSVPRIHVDKTEPEVTVDVQAMNPVTNGFYKEGSEFIIRLTTNEEAYLDSSKDSYVKVWFVHSEDDEVEGEFNNGKAQFVSETKNADNTVTYTYRYVASEGDYGTFKYLKVGTFVDIAGNEKEYTEPEEGEEDTLSVVVETIKVNAVRPTVAIKALDKDGKVIYNKGFNDESAKDKTSNADEITYVFTWSEKVTGFTADDIILSSTLEKVYEDGEVAFVEPEEANEDGTYTYTLKVKTLTNRGIAKVVIPAGAVEDVVGHSNVENSLELGIDKIMPTLLSASAIYDEENKTITIEAIFDEPIMLPEEAGAAAAAPATEEIKPLRAIITTDTSEEETNSVEIDGNKATYIYEVKGNESGKVKITLSGKISDKVNNINENINAEVENDISLTRTGISVTEGVGDEATQKIYKFKKGTSEDYLDISKPVYLKRGDSIAIYEITKNEANEEVATLKGSYSVSTRLDDEIDEGRLETLGGVTLPEDVNIIVDITAPTLNKKIYVDEALENGRYTTGKEVIIELTSSEVITENTTTPTVLVAFDNSGIGKYDYNEETGSGYARLKEVITNDDNTTTWKYVYKVQNGDEGKVIVAVSSDIYDLAGNKNPLNEVMPTIKPHTSEVTFDNVLLDKEKDLRVSYKFYKYNESNGLKEIDPNVLNSYVKDDEIIVETTFNKILYKKVGESNFIGVIDGAQTSQLLEVEEPTLHLKYANEGTMEVIPTYIGVDYDTNTMEVLYHYKFKEEDVPERAVQITDVILNKDIPSGTVASTYFVEYSKNEVEYSIDNIVDDATSIYHYINYQVEIKDKSTDICSENMFVGEVTTTLEGSIYADTTRPTVTITSNEGLITNAEEITYTFKWNEDVINFTEDDIEVINGTKKEGTFEKISDREYKVVVIPTIQDTGDLYVRVAAMACEDLAGLENIERVSETIRIDKITPIIVGTPTVRKDEDQIIVEATFSKEIAEAKDSYIDVVIGGEEGKGIKDVVQVDGNRVTYVYNISEEDNGPLEITIKGTVTDKAGNISRDLNYEVETTFEIDSGLGTTYAYYKKENAEATGTQITSFENPTYLVDGNVLEIVKTVKSAGGTVTPYYYELEVTKGTEEVSETQNGLIKYIKLTDIDGEEKGTIEIVPEGTEGLIRILGKNIYVDTHAPKVTKTVYVEEALENGRYTFGKEIIIDLTTEDDLNLDSCITPSVKVGFTKSGEGKYNYYNEENGSGFAKFKGIIHDEENNTLTYRYIYKIQNEDDGEVITTYTAGKLVDNAGNQTTLKTGAIPELANTNSDENKSLRVVIDEAKGIYGNYELFRGEDETPVTDFSSPIKFNSGEQLKIKLTFNKPIVYVNAPGSDDTTVYLKDPFILKINDSIVAENEMRDYLIVTNNEELAISQTWTYVFGDEALTLNSFNLYGNINPSGTYYVTRMGEGTDERVFDLDARDEFKVNVQKAIDISGLNIFAGNYDIHTDIYADTLKPTVKITALNSRGNATTRINGQENVKFTFKWDEVVTGFTVDDIEVTNGTIIEGTFREIKPGLEYSVDVKPNETESELQVKVEADCCKDLVGLGNVARVSDTIEVDTKKPQYQSAKIYRLEQGGEDKIIVEVNFDEKIDDVSNLVATIMIDGTPVTDISEPEITDTRVTYTYDVKSTDNGWVTLKLEGTVSDLAENISNEINETINGGFRITSEIGTNYIYKLNGTEITDFVTKKYLNANNNKLTIEKVEKDDFDGNGTIDQRTTTYEGDIIDSTTNGDLEYVNLVDPTGSDTIGTIEFATGTFDVKLLNIHIDTKAPTATTAMTAVNPRTSERYTVGDEFIITVKANEKLDVSDESKIPVIGVNFGKEAGKFNRGEALFVEKTDAEDGTSVLTYRYVATIGDEGKPILEYKSGILVDLAGNENPLVKNSEVDVEIDANNSYGVTKIEFLDKNGNILKENAVLPEELHVKLYFEDGLYTAINTPINSETAPSLYLNDDIKGTVENVTISASNNSIKYKFTELQMDNIAAIRKLELKNETDAKLYAGSSIINNATEINSGVSWEINIDNSNEDLIINNIYVDTTAPRVAIIPEADPTNAHIDENKNEVTYTLKWNEKVNGFDESAIKVNYGEIIPDTFSEVEGAEGLEYTFKVKPNTTIGHVGHLEVIVEQDRCIDGVGLGNIRTESNITIDKITPVYESYVVDDTSIDAEGNKLITVIAKFSEEVGDTNNSNITVKVNGRNGNGTVQEPVIMGDKVKYIYKVSPMDDGKVEIELKGKIKDVAGNPSNEFKVNIENDIELKGGVIEISGIKYSFAKEGREIDNFIEPTYFKEGQTIRVTKAETIVVPPPEGAEEGAEPTTEIKLTYYDYKVENKYANNTHITKMTLIEPEEGEEIGSATFENGLDISLANIYFDTTVPKLTEEVIRNENGKNIYGTNEEITIKLMTNEPINENLTIVPKLAVRFGEKLGNYNASEAKLVSTEVVEGNTVWTYTYKVVPGDNGELSTQFTGGKLVDLAENEAVLTNLNLPTVHDGDATLTSKIKELEMDQLDPITNEPVIDEETGEVVKIDNSATVTYSIYRSRNGIETKLTNFDSITEFKPNDVIKVVAEINKKIYETWGSTETVLSKENAPTLKINNGIDMNCEDVAFNGYTTSITYTYTVDSSINPSQLESLNLRTNSADQYYADESHPISNRSDDNIAYIKVAGNTGVNTDIRGLKLVFNKYDNVAIERGVFADTVAPEVTIVAKVGENEISNLFTNSNTIDYELTWSEEVKEFTIDDITVNNGEKGELSEATENEDGTYTYHLRVTGITEGITQIIVEAGKVLDKANLGNPRQEMKINVDNTAPIYISLDAYAESTDGLKLSPEIDTVREYHGKGDIITITATFNENIAAEDKPVLSLQFSESGNAKGTVSEGEIIGNRIIYTYTIVDGDEGELSIKGYTGPIKDIAGNETRVTKKSLDGDTIIADTAAPVVKMIDITSPEPGKYTVGTEVIVEVEYTENVYYLNSETHTIELFTAENMPNQQLDIGHSNLADFKDLTPIGYGETEGKVDRSKLKYKYVIQEGDNGECGVVFESNANPVPLTSRNVCDLAGNYEVARTNSTDVFGPNNLKVIADTVRPEINTNGVTARVETPTITGTGTFYREGNEVTIKLNFKEPVKPSTTEPKIKIGFSEIEGEEPAAERYREIDTIDLPITITDPVPEDDAEDPTTEEVNPYSTEITYKYTIQEGDNGNIWIIVPEDQFEDEGGNKNIAYQLITIPAEGEGEEPTTTIVGKEIRTIYADTTRPTLTIYENTTAVQNGQTITVVATFSEDIYELRNNSRITLSTANAPKLIYSFGNGENKEAAATSVAGNKITYVITKHNENDNGDFHRTFVKGNLCDRAGNLLIDNEAESIDTTAPVLRNVTITNDGEYGAYCKAGTKIYVTATFDEDISNVNMKLKVKVGEVDKGPLQGVINTEDRKQVIFTYEVQNGDNGQFTVIDVEGVTDNTIEDENADKTYGYVEDSKGNRSRVYNFTNVTGTSIADTIDPYITQIEAIENGRTRIIYSKATASDDARVFAIRTNSNIVEYIITYSEDVTKLEGEKITITNASIIDEITPIGNNKFKVTVETNAEGVQSLTIRNATVEDRAGNTDKYLDGYLRLSAVTTDYTVPTVRFISEYNGGSYVLPTNINKIELRPNIEVSEDIDTIEYAWGTDEYEVLTITSSSSDIAIPSKTVTERGTYTLHIKVKDLAGNVNEATKTYNVLDSKVRITDVTEAGAEDTTDRLLNVLFETGLTDNRKVEFKSAKTNQVVTLRPTGTSENGATYTITENGIVYAEATDKAGNKVFTEYEILITGPEFEVIGNPEKWTNQNAILKVITDEKISALTVNGTNILDTRGAAVAQNGTYIFVATLEANGYRTATTKEINVTMIDKESPTISDVRVNRKVISIAATDIPAEGGSGIAEYAITTTTEVPTEWSTSGAIETTEDGVFYAWARDKAGNVSLYAEPIIVDTTPPEITFEFASLKEIVGKQIGAVIKTNEEAIISFSWNDEEWAETEEYETSVKAVKLARAEGDYTLYAKAVDRFGNESAVKTLEFKVVEKEEVQVPEIEFEDLTTVQIDGVKYVKVSPNITQEAITGHMNTAKLLGTTPTYANLTDDEKIKTGTEIKIDGATQYIIIVKGDVNCDGNVTIRDVISANAIRGEEETANILKVLAADINGTNRIEVRDLISMNSFRTTE